jgi:3-hydroxyisobutyrate dehydrogenase-like beta-hydroxyacid dehydrogenase
MTETTFRHLAIIGFGEVGGIFGTDLAAAGIHVSVFDILLNKEKFREAMLTKAKTAKVRAADSLKEAVLGAELVIAAVTASSATDVAKDAAAILKPGQFYMDLNSVSPKTKTKVAESVGKSGADFVEAAVVAPVAPQRLKVPMLLGGARAGELASRLQVMGMDTTAVSERIGVASAIKMCRSVVMKGIAALAIESLVAARRYGVEDAVIASFEATYPNMGWAKSLPDNLAKRAAEHSRRRAVEMREVAETLQDVGIDPVMALGTAEVQDWLTAEMEAGKLVFSAKDFSWRSLADAIDARTSPDRKRA